MANDPRPNDMSELWQNQDVESFHMSPEEIRRKAREYRTRVLWRNLREYAAGVFLVVFFGWCLWKFPYPLLRIGCGLLMAGSVYMMVQLHRRGSTRAPAHVVLAACLDYHRGELERQRDLLRSVWSWYLAPFVPGLAVLSAGFALSNPGHVRHIGRVLVLYDALIALAFWWVWNLNRRAARKLQRQIEDLDAIEKQPR